MRATMVLMVLMVAGCGPVASVDAGGEDAAVVDSGAADAGVDARVDEPDAGPCTMIPPGECRSVSIDSCGRCINACRDEDGEAVRWRTQTDGDGGECAPVASVCCLSVDGICQGDSPPIGGIGSCLFMF